MAVVIPPSFKNGGKGFGIKQLIERIEQNNAAYKQQALPFFGFEQGIGAERERYAPLLFQQISDPTASEAYKTNLREALDAGRAQYAAIGSPSSGASQFYGAKVATDLAAKEMDKRNAMLMAASQFRGMLPQWQEPQYLNAAVAGHGARAGYINALANLNNSVTAASQGGGGGMGFSSPLGTLSGMLGGSMMNQMGSGGSMFGLNSRPAGVEGPLNQGGGFYSNPFASLMGSGSSGAAAGGSTDMFGNLFSFWGS